MRKFNPGRAPLGWLAGALLIAVGFVVGVTVTSGGGRGHSVPGGFSTPESTAGPLVTQGEVHTYADVAEVAMPSVVNISTDKVVKGNTFQHPFMDDPMWRRFFGEPEDGQERSRVERSLGSGVIVREDGYILTSNHVIEQASKIRVLMNDNQEYEAKIIGQDPQTDVALIKVEAKGLPALRMGDSQRMRIGDQVMAVGNPFGVGQTVTVGIVSAIGRSIGLIDYEEFIQTDASINPGNSGGALVNMTGELVGINTAILSRTGGSQGIGFAIPSNMARTVMESLITDGKVTRAWLGVQVQDVDQALAEAHGLSKPKGVLVAEVTADTPAQKAGVKESDVILAVDGREVNDRAQLRNRISLAGVGTTVQLTVWRDGRERTVPVKLAALPENPQIAARDGGGAEEGEGAGLEGVAVQELTRERRRAAGVPDEVDGVIVARVERTSNAYSEGLREGDVITEVFREPVTSVSEYRAQVRTQGTRPVLLRVYKPGPNGEGGGRIFMAIAR